MIARRAFLLQAAALLALAATRRDGLAREVRSLRPGFPHPEPRPGITSENVLPESELGSSKRTRDAYDAARTYPELFDGVYCVCECDKSMDHRSLLSCFESRQAIGCMACRDEAKLVARMARDGKSLEEIRAAIDEEFGN